jgi:hypothetical protein
MFIDADITWWCPFAANLLCGKISESCILRQFFRLQTWDSHYPQINYNLVQRASSWWFYSPIKTQNHDPQTCLLKMVTELFDIPVNLIHRA